MRMSFGDFNVSYSIDCHQHGASALRRGRVLIDAGTVAAVQFLDEGFAQVDLALSVEEIQALTLLLDVAVHNDAELRELGVEQHIRREPCRVVKQCIDMEVHLYGSSGDERSLFGSCVLWVL